MTSFGKYLGYNTIVHRLDSRVKLITMIVFMVTIFISISSPWMNLLTYGVIFIILLITTFISKASFTSLFKSLKALWFMIILLLIINIFFSSDKTSQVLFTIPFNSTNEDAFCIRLGPVINVSYIFIRLLLVLMTTNILTCTTKPMDLTNALEWLFYPLKLIKVPVHKFAMALSLALRFIPTLQEETNRIMKAQASRGVDFNQGKFKDKIKALSSLIIPLFMTAFLTSGELADAMEARGYDPDSKRTKFKPDKWGIKDTTASLLTAIYLAAIIFMAVKHVDIFNYFNIQTPTL